MLIDILKRKYSEIPKPVITLCKSDLNRTPMHELEEAYSISTIHRFADVDEINFEIPYYIMKFGNKIKNPRFDLIKGDLLLHVKTLDKEQYFIIKNAELSGDDKEIKSVKAYSLEYTFSDKLVRGYEGIKKIYDNINPDNGVLNYIVSEFPYWSIDYVNPEITLKNRTFDVSEQNMWDFLIDLQTTYECILLFNTVDRNIRVEKLENIGQNTGLIINQDNYIKNINIKPIYDEVITRLHVYGQDNISIRRMNPSGTDYIEIYTYFKNTDFMSQSLIDSLNAYESLIITKTNEFNILLDQLDILESELTDLYVNPDTGLNKLQADLNVIRSLIYVTIEENEDHVLDLTDLRTQELNKETEINNKLVQINNKEIQIDNKLGQITSVRNEIRIENNFTSDQIKEWSFFWKSKTWQDNNYFDTEELYEDAKQYLLRLAQPALQFDIDSVCFLNSLDEQVNWDKIIYGLGDLINIEYDKFGTELEVRLVSYTYDYDGDGLSLEFSNKSSIDDPLVYLENLLSNSISTSTTVNIERFKYGQYSEERNDIQDYINSELDLSAQTAKAGQGNDVTIDGQGITLTSENNPNNIVRLMSNLMVFSNDNLNTVGVAISPDGIVNERVLCKVINVSESIKEVDKIG